MNTEQSVKDAIENIEVYAGEQKFNGCDIETIFNMGLGAFAVLQFQTENSLKQELLLLYGRPECLAVKWVPNA